MLGCSHTWTCYDLHQRHLSLSGSVKCFDSSCQTHLKLMGLYGFGEGIQPFDSGVLEKRRIYKLQDGRYTEQDLGTSDLHHSIVDLIVHLEFLSCRTINGPSHKSEDLKSSEDGWVGLTSFHFRPGKKPKHPHIMMLPPSWMECSGDVQGFPAHMEIKLKVSQLTWRPNLSFGLIWLETSCTCLLSPHMASVKLHMAESRWKKRQIIFILSLMT